MTSFADSRFEIQISFLLSELMLVGLQIQILTGKFTQKNMLISDVRSDKIFAFEAEKLVI